MTMNENQRLHEIQKKYIKSLSKLNITQVATVMDYITQVTSVIKFSYNTEMNKTMAA